MKKPIDEIREKEVKMDLTPMIDVTFLLLVFFMVSAKFKTQEGEIETFLPKNRGMASASYKEPPQETRIRIGWYQPSGYQLSKDPNNGRPVMKVGSASVGFRKLENGQFLPDYPALIKYLERAKASYRGDDSLPVIIDAQPLVPWKWIIRTVDAVVEAKVENLTFAAKEEPY